MKYKAIIEKCNPSQTHEELNDLLLALEGMSIKNVLEIGVHMAGSIKVWREVFNPDLLIGIDNEIHPEFEKVQNVVKIEGVSQSQFVQDEVTSILGDKKLDFLFIDGGHLYNEVKADFYIYKKFVRPGGVVAFHDVILQGNETCEVYQFWNEIKDEYITKTISYKEQLGDGATGCGVVYL